MYTSTPLFLFLCRHDIFGCPGQLSCQFTFPKLPLICPFQTLTDLNDYITPSQACIKPLEQSNAPIARTPGDAAVCADVSQDTYDLLGVDYDHADRDPG
jgi:hypothetical protein